MYIYIQQRVNIQKEIRNERLENDALGLVVHNKELDSNAFLRCRLGDRRLIRICSWRSAGCSWVRGWLELEAGQEEAGVGRGWRWSRVSSALVEVDCCWLLLTVVG